MSKYNMYEYLSQKSCRVPWCSYVIVTSMMYYLEKSVCWCVKPHYEPQCFVPILFCSCIKVPEVNGTLDMITKINTSVEWWRNFQMHIDMKSEILCILADKESHCRGTKRSHVNLKMLIGLYHCGCRVPIKQNKVQNDW